MAAGDLNNLILQIEILVKNAQALAATEAQTAANSKQLAALAKVIAALARLTAATARATGATETATAATEASAEASAAAAAAAGKQAVSVAALREQYQALAERAAILRAMPFISGEEAASLSAISGQMAAIKAQAVGVGAEIQAASSSTSVWRRLNTGLIGDMRMIRYSMYAIATPLMVSYLIPQAIKMGQELALWSQYVAGYDEALQQAMKDTIAYSNRHIENYRYLTLAQKRHLAGMKNEHERAIELSQDYILNAKAALENMRVQRLAEGAAIDNIKATAESIRIWGKWLSILAGPLRPVAKGVADITASVYEYAKGLGAAQEAHDKLQDVIEAASGALDDFRANLDKARISSDKAAKGLRDAAAGQGQLATQLQRANEAIKGMLSDEVPSRERIIVAINNQIDAAGREIAKDRELYARKKITLGEMEKDEREYTELVAALHKELELKLKAFDEERSARSAEALSRAETRLAEHIDRQSKETARANEAMEKSALKSALDSGKAFEKQLDSLDKRLKEENAKVQKMLNDAALASGRAAVSALAPTGFPPLAELTRSAGQIQIQVINRKIDANQRLAEAIARVTSVQEIQSIAFTRQISRDVQQIAQARVRLQQENLRVAAMRQEASALEKEAAQEEKLAVVTANVTIAKRLEAAADAQNAAAKQLNAAATKEQSDAERQYLESQIEAGVAGVASFVGMIAGRKAQAKVEGAFMVAEGAFDLASGIFPPNPLLLAKGAGELAAGVEMLEVAGAGGRVAAGGGGGGGGGGAVGRAARGRAGAGGAQGGPAGTFEEGGFQQLPHTIIQIQGVVSADTLNTLLPQLAATANRGTQGGTVTLVSSETGSIPRPAA